MSQLERFLPRGKEQKPEGDFSQLGERAGQVWNIAHEFGLDPFATDFEIVPSHIMHELGAYGIPGHFSHWTFGRTFRELKTTYDYGLSKMYELVINSDPAQAFLLDNNNVIQNTVVMAHVLGHTDFMKHNVWFKNTRRDMVHASEVKGEKIRSYEFKEGEQKVEDILDAALSIAEHIDPYRPYRLSSTDQLHEWKEEWEERQKRRPLRTDFDDIFELGIKKPEEKKGEKMPIPLDSEKDVLWFIRNFAPDLKEWERDIIDIVRDESIYFWPQRQTKIMNEGWAAFWHKQIMHEMSDRQLIDQSEDLNWLEIHAGVVNPLRPRGINPYFFGMKMFEWLVDYYNGQIDEVEKKWLEQEKYPVYPEYHGQFVGSPGYKKIFEVRELENDQAFIRNNFLKPFSDRLHLYVYEGRNVEDKKVYAVSDKDWKVVRDEMVKAHINSGVPYVTVTDGDYRGRGELYLKHTFEGQEIDVAYLKKTVPLIYRLWKKPVNFETVISGRIVLFYYDGQKGNEFVEVYDPQRGFTPHE